VTPSGNGDKTGEPEVEASQRENLSADAVADEGNASVEKESNNNSVVNPPAEAPIKVETKRVVETKKVAEPKAPASSSVGPGTKNATEDKTQVHKVEPTGKSVPPASPVAQREPVTGSKFLSTLTKSPTKTDRKSPSVAGNRFAGFKSMTANIAAKSAERVAKVKDQIQKEEEGNRFSGFKNMANNMAAKGAERVAKVKDQMQKEEEGKRFAGFKSMTANIAAKGAERVAKVKDQMQKEEEGNRFSGFKNMANNIKAKGAEQVAKVKDQMQKEEEANVNLFAGMKTMAGNMASNRAKSLASAQATSTQVVPRLTAATLPAKAASPVSSSAAAPKTPAQASTTTITDTKPSSRPSINPTVRPATPPAAKIAEESAPKNEVLLSTQAVPTDVQTNEEGKSTSETATNDTVEPESPEVNENDLSLSLSIEEPNAAAIDVSKQNASTKHLAENSSEVKSPKSGAESTSATSQDVDASKETKGSATPSTKDVPVKPKPEEAKEMSSGSQMMENGPKPTSQESDTKASPSEPTASKSPTEIETSTISKTAGTSNEPQAQQSSPPTQGTSDQIEALQKELHAAHALIMELQHHENDEKDRPSDAVLVELQANLQKEMTRRAEAEDKARVAIKKSKRIEEEYTTYKTLSKGNLNQLTSSVETLTREKDTMEKDLKAKLEKETTGRAEAEKKAGVAISNLKRISEEYTKTKKSSKGDLDEMKSCIESLTKENATMEKELAEIREERDEQARKEMALTTRLNAAKKKEATKTNTTEHYTDQIQGLELAVKEYESKVESLTAERDQFEVELGEWKEYAEKRTKQLETALNDEKKLNDERKKKMKGFVEAKTEEVRSAKADYLSLQTELDQTSHSLTELNQRYKQLHAQWVQSQTRNRELQRDALKMKKDSEKMTKVGDSLEARLSRSAQQMDDHKNKRVQARNELMSVLGQLEAERAVNSRLQESIKMTFTPKALSQQQTIREALDDFEAALQKLSTRIGRPVPPSFTNDPDEFVDDDGLNGTDTAENDDGNKQGTVTLSEINSNRAVQKLDTETKRVSQNIVQFSANIERMHSLLDGGGTRSCVDVFSQLLVPGSPPAIKAAPTRKSSGQRYGQISRNTPG